MVVTLGGLQSNEAIAKEIARKLKVNKVSNISILQVDRNGNSLADQKNWVSYLAQPKVDKDGYKHLSTRLIVYALW